MYSRHPITWRRYPSSDANGTRSRAASAAATTSSTRSSPMFSRALLTEWNRNGSPSAIASSYRPNRARRCSTKSSSQARAVSGVTGSQKSCGSPGRVAGIARPPRRSPPRVISSCGSTGSGGTSIPARGSGSRLSASKFQRLPAGAVAVHQDAGAAALPPIEVLHPRVRRRGGEPLVDDRRRREEQGVRVDARPQPFVGAEPQQSLVDPAVGGAHPREGVDPVLPHEGAKAVQESEAAVEPDPLHPPPRALEPVRGVPHGGEQQHDLVRVVPAPPEGGIRFDEEHEVDLGVVEGRMPLEDAAWRARARLSCGHDATRPTPEGSWRGRRSREGRSCTTAEILGDTPGCGIRCRRVGDDPRRCARGAPQRGTRPRRNSRRLADSQGCGSDGSSSTCCSATCIR